MPSDKPDRVEKWRHPVSAVQTLTQTAFAEMVIESGLRIVGPIAGYLYAARSSDDGHDLFRTMCGHKWIYQARRVATQANAGGGAILVDITVAAGQVARLVAMRAQNSGTNGLSVRLFDEDTNSWYNIATIASAAGTYIDFPSIGAAASTSGAVANSVGLMIAPGQGISVSQTGAGAQNDTLTIELIWELFNLSTIPTWDKSRSTNAADVTLAASTISDANTLQEVLC